MALKCTAFFQDSLTLYGWSETYYVDTNDYDLAGNLMGLLLGFRMQLATVTVQCTWVRISDPTVDRDVNILQKRDLPRSDGSIVATSAPDFCAVLVRLAAGPQQWSHLFLRGFPRDNMAGDDYENADPFNTNFTNYETFLRAHFNLQVAQRVPIVGRAPITSITPIPNRGMTIASPSSPPAIGKTIRIGGVSNDMEGANGYKIATSLGVVAGTFNVGGARPVGVYPGDGGYWVPVDFDYPNILTAHIKRITHRAAGRPFAQRRGRRSNRIPLRQ